MPWITPGMIRCRFWLNDKAAVIQAAAGSCGRADDRQQNVALSN